ncbi:maltokinase N-terminal cap-like domain-containing protein [Actinomadura gamaensis]|uniref:1,4-alpha-glucan branching protein n=1 Tax=Actinomadura gamaensis TaxID=1763541 RepID=A0ABV9U1S1_9ACTN
MAVIHNTELKPSKLELLAVWLPSRAWYRGTDEPELAKAGGFRLDDPEGEVGMEFMVVTDSSGDEPVTYLVPLTYRGAPLDGAEDALVGTMEHGVLGRRWAYDGYQDPVLVAQLLALIEGRAEAQHQNQSDTPDREVTRAYSGAGFDPAVLTAIDDEDGTELRGPQGTAVRLNRVLRSTSDLPEGATGHLSGAWTAPDGTATHGLFAVTR